MPPIFQRLRDLGFDLRVTYHADAILHEHFSDAVEELEKLILAIGIPIEELIRGGGGEAQVTQRLRKSLSNVGWKKANFRVEKKINDRTTSSQSHEVDHVKVFDNGTVALEIEWNNKDPFFDRDLENFNRLHADGAISIGVIITRGSTLQEGLEPAVRSFAEANDFSSYEDLEKFGVRPTGRQRHILKKLMKDGTRSFADAWAKALIADKFGKATTHWGKLDARLNRGIGSPCPLVVIGIPLSCVTGLPADKGNSN